MTALEADVLRAVRAWLAASKHRAAVVAQTDAAQRSAIDGERAAYQEMLDAARRLEAGEQ